MFFFFLMIRRPPRSTLDRSSAASDVYKRQAIESDGWGRLLKEANVRYLGISQPDDLVRHMCEATVGIIPFVQDQMIRNSLPLKSYEYIACGLPVVSVPITSLEREPRLISVATTASEFKVLILEAARSRFDAATLEIRRNVALANSYDRRFFDVCEALIFARAVSYTHLTLPTSDLV